jgi:hypothetical protein
VTVLWEKPLCGRLLERAIENRTLHAKRRTILRWLAITSDPRRAARATRLWHFWRRAST